MSVGEKCEGCFYWRGGECKNEEDPFYAEDCYVSELVKNSEERGVI